MPEASVEVPEMVVLLVLIALTVGQSLRGKTVAPATVGVSLRICARKIASRLPVALDPATSD